MVQKNPSFETLFIARQPVFRSDETVWGYELLFRSNEENVAVVDNEAQATSSVIADGLALASEGINPDLKILINFPEQLLIEDAGFALPKDRCIIEILENVRAMDEVLDAARRLKDAGYTLAMDDYCGQAELKPFLELADIVKVDILALNANPGCIRSTLASIPEGAMLLAEKVEDVATFNFLKKKKFSLFQGFFFSKPEIIPGKKLSSSIITKLQILSELSKPDLEPARLGEILRSDPSLTYRLFRYINSAGIGLQEKVSSVKRAIDMMGMLQAKQWLRSALIADFNTTPRSGELAYLAVQRAKFLESVCDSSNLDDCVPDSLFMTGLFSLLDAMLGLKMNEILKLLPLEESVEQALMGEGRLHDLLRLVSSYERGQWEETFQRLQKVGLESSQAELVYVQSRNWALKMLGSAHASSADAR
ncbi:MULTISPECIES: HDOD domain-containing protein [unclassified Pseudodesulfovibrio]|uniref:EAL and HDOD domain-containing protein n=1 Tax=unclassified Pseudodesulfovibrio TaxID=2661612 RepID=UPI000FEB9018|nr:MULTISPECIES: HDOD domain-containing protein [unclassified Pseudodesulfovibrio]MCJ2165985.1 HDOD domain-containing protein [Pseudodesulfovibrio sp. S3-i]RWU02577.1 HDOD domain-containing protein [Pseudodesulfovibrio sp. S3]